MDDRELERLVRDTYADMPVPPLRARRPAPRRSPLAAVAAVVGAIVLGLAIGTALPRLREVPAAVPPGGPYAVLFAEGSAERFLVVDAEGRTIATMDRGSPLTVSSLAPSPDGRLVAYWRSSVTDAELLVWDVARGHISALFRSGDRVGGAIIWAPDSRSLVTSVGSQATSPGVPPRTSRLLRVHIDGTIATLMQVTDAIPPTLVAYDGQTVAALGGETLITPRSGPPARRETAYVRIIPVGQQQQTLAEGAGVLLPSTFANPRSQDGATVAGNFKEFESVEPNDIRAWRIESFAQPIARHLERGAEGALLWPGRDAVLFVRMTGPEQGTLKALRFGGPQRVDELGPTDGVPLALDPSGRWLLTSGPSLHPIDGQAVGAARRLAVPLLMRAIGWVVSGGVSRNPPPTPQPPSCERAGTSAEDVVRAFLDEVRKGDVNGMIGCWSPGRFTFADASAYARTRLLDSEVERFGSEARDSEGRPLLSFRIRAGWELRERSPWRTDGGCCERVVLVRQHESGTWRIDSSQTVSAKSPPNICDPPTGLRPEQVVDAWFTLLADERAADMVACWSDTIADRDALMRGYIGAGGVTRVQIGEATPTRSGAVAIRVVVHWRRDSAAWTSGQTKWLIVRRQADGRWAIESTATGLVPDVQ